jgi:REP-associated tyrosine transposase
MPRPHRPEKAGRVFHVTVRATTGRRLFVVDADRELFLRLLDKIVRRYGWEVLAWCLMGTHYHLLVRTPRPTLGVGMRDLNGIYARAFNERHGEFGSLLAERYKDRVVRSDEHLMNALQYIALNPMRAGLVRRPEHWRWSSHAALAGLVRRPFVLAARVALRAWRGKAADYRAFVDSCAGLGSRLRSAFTSGTSQTTASGGRTTSAENACSPQGTGSASTPRPLPTSEPP